MHGNVVTEAPKGRPMTAPVSWRRTLLPIVLLVLVDGRGIASTEPLPPPTELESLRSLPNRTLVRVRVDRLLETTVSVALFRWHRAENVIGPLLQIAWATGGDEPSESLVVGDTLWAVRPTESEEEPDEADTPVEVGREYWLVIRRGGPGMGMPYAERWLPVARADGRDAAGADAEAEPFNRPGDRMIRFLRRSSRELIMVRGRAHPDDESDGHGDPARQEQRPGVIVVASEIGAIGRNARVPVDLGPRTVVFGQADTRMLEELTSDERWLLVASAEDGGRPEVISAESLDDVAGLDEPTPPPPAVLNGYRVDRNRALVYAEVRSARDATYGHGKHYRGNEIELLVIEVAWENDGTPGSSMSPGVNVDRIREVQVSPKNSDPLAPQLDSLRVGDRGWFVIAGGASGTAGILAVAP